MLTIFEKKFRIFFIYDNYFDHKGIIGLINALKKEKKCNCRTLESLPNPSIHWPNNSIIGITKALKKKKNVAVEPRRSYLTRVFIDLTKASLA